MNVIYREQVLYRYLKYATVLYVQWLGLDFFTNSLCKSLRLPWAVNALQNVAYSQDVENIAALLNKVNRNAFNGEPYEMESTLVQRYKNTWRHLVRSSELRTLYSNLKFQTR